MTGIILSEGMVGLGGPLQAMLFPFTLVWGWIRRGQPPSISSKSLRDVGHLPHHKKEFEYRMRQLKHLVSGEAAIV